MIKKNTNRYGLTLVELLVTITMALLILGSCFYAFIQIINSSNEAEIKIEALNNARTALDIISKEVKAAYTDPISPPISFVGIDLPFTYGDGIDNDKDGVIDEEQLNGLDDDNDWVVADDRDTEIANITGMPVVLEKGFQQPDLGDYHVDEDVIFKKSEMFFHVLNSETGNIDNVKYYIGTYEGIKNVLIRTYTENAFSGVSVPVESPMAFNVLSINYLYWEANNYPKQWVTSWDSTTITGNVSGAYYPKFLSPISVYISITIKVGDKPIETVAGRSIYKDIITLNTMVNIEQMLNDSRYTSIRNRD